LIHECDAQSKLLRKSIKEVNKEIMNLKYIGNHTLVVDEVPCDRSTKELIHIIDSNKMAKKVCKNKFKEYNEQIDLDARRQFHSATRSAVKCMIGFNHYGERHKIINRNLP